MSSPQATKINQYDNKWIKSGDKIKEQVAEESQPNYDTGLEAESSVLEMSIVVPSDKDEDVDKLSQSSSDRMSIDEKPITGHLRIDIRQNAPKIYVSVKSEQEIQFNRDDIEESKQIRETPR